jgi:phosphoenolpyruvate synthase/pyruvate phosphate dikinase
MDGIDPYDHEIVASTFGVTHSLACELMWMNDEAVAYWKKETPEERFVRVRRAIQNMIVEDDGASG